MSVTKPISSRFRAAALILCVLAACSREEAGTDPPGGGDADRLRLIFEEARQDSLQRSALLRLREGLPVEALDDLSLAGHQAYLERVRDWRSRLGSIDLEALDEGDRVSAEALLWGLDIELEGERWFWHEGVLSSYLSPLPDLWAVFAALPLASQEDRAAFLDLLEGVPDFVGRLEERVRGQAERGIVLWGANLEPSLDLVRTLDQGLDSGPFRVSRDRLEGVESEAAGEFLDRAAEVVSTRIRPATVKLLGFLEGDYARAAPVGVGASQWPEGDDYYRFATRRSTTLDVTPEEVHETGVALVAQMEEEMAALRRQVGFEGSREEFHAALRSDAQFFPQSTEEVEERLMSAATAMEEVLGDYFLSPPASPYGVERLDPDLEASQTYGYYDPPRAERDLGIYYFNGSRLSQRSWLNLRAVSLHELIPGHHFHISRQIADQTLPEFRRSDWHGAYTEGWGSYASWLGVEAGIFEGDVYSHYGMYVLEIFLATRLVVDPGMNLLGWTLEEGREFMREHTLESETQIATESLRYAADMPGQAVAYQMGKLKFLELRERAERLLGDGFDVREFHETVLECGSLPMAVLEGHVDRWIDGQLEP